MDETTAKDVFLEAADLQGEERRAYLDRVCGVDVALRKRVDELLAAATDQIFLGRATVDVLPASTAAALSPEEQPGARIGPYRLIERIGEGGFGSVYMAEQESPVRRLVALKIIKLGMDTSAVVGRFEQERQALAIMDHPHIAKVLDAGATASGRPYFVMELVKGDPITAYSDKHALPIPERIELFLQVCEAVQHAHTKGVIHRDIKPGNVLVCTQDGRPFARVIDFGIAKATAHRLIEKSVFTEFRQLVGTPEYMSPEQAEGSLDIDTRTDVYSLGVLLYELLTGTTPFEPKRLRSAAFAEMQRIIREDDPPRPSTRLTQSSDTIGSIAAARKVEPWRLGSLVRGELDWIAMRALEKDRARRYESPGALATDCRRHLAGEPVGAAPPGAAYHLRKFVRRHRVGVTAGALVSASLVVGLGTALWQANVARTQRDAAKKAAQEALTAKNEAETRRKETEQVANFQAAQLAEIRPSLMAQRLREDLIAEARSASERAGDDATKSAAATEAFQRGLAPLNLTNVALKSLDRNIFDATKKAADRDFADQPLVRANINVSMGSALRLLGLLEHAHAPIDDAVATRERLLGKEHPDTLTALQERADLLLDEGNIEEGEALLKRVYETRRRTLGLGHEDTVTSLGNLTRVLTNRSRHDEAEDTLRAFLDGVRAVYPASNPRSVAAVGYLANVQMARGNLEEAERLFREACERSASFTGADEAQAVTNEGNLGLVLLRQGKFPEAEKAMLSAIERHRRVLGDDHQQTILVLNNLGTLYARWGRTEQAAAINERVLEAARRTLGLEHPLTLTVLSNRALDFYRRREFTRAEEMYRQALEGQVALLGPDHEDAIVTRYSLGATLREQGRLQEGETYAREAYERAGRSLKRDNRWRITTAIGLGQVLTARERFAEGETVLMGEEAVLRPSAPESPGAHGAARALYLKWARAVSDLYSRWAATDPKAHDANASEWAGRVRAAEEAANPGGGK